MLKLRPLFVFVSLLVLMVAIFGDCTENWTVRNGSCLTNDSQLMYYVDENSCNTTTNLPPDNGTYTTCNYCSENITGPYNTTCNSSNQLTQYYVDNNYATCCAVTNISSDCDINNGSYDNQTLSCGSPPVLSLSFASPTPSNNSYVNGDETIKATATGDIVNITIRINGTLRKTCSSSPCSFDWDTTETDYEDGRYNVSALANDSAGNSTSIERNITVDNTKPVIKSVSLSDSSVNEGDEVTVKANVSDNIGMDWVKVKVGDDTYTMPYSSSSGLYEEELNAPDTNGTYKVNVTAQDKAGNLAYNDSLTLTVSESSEELETMTVTITGNCSEITVTSSAGTGVYATLQYHSSTAGWITVVNGTKLTDSDGKAKFPITSSGDYKAVCTKSGYNEKTSSVFSAPSCTSVPECTADANCTGGKKCVDGACVTPACTANENCSSNKKCASGSCVSVSCPCGVISNHSCVAYECCSNSDCQSGKECVNTTHTCVTTSVQNITNESEAENAIDGANDTISAAKLEGKNITEAEDFLAQAEEAFESGNYDGALLLASKAKQAALSASVLSKSVNENGLFEMPAIDLSFISSMDPTLLLCLGGGVIVISAIVILFILFLIFIFFILRKRKTGEEVQKKKRLGKEEWEKPGDEQDRISP